MTERTKFLARVAEAREVGLRDIKFFCHPNRPVKSAEIFASLNEIEDAIRQGNCVRHVKWSGDDAVRVAPIN